MTPAPPVPPVTGGLTLPRVVSGRFTIKVATGRGRFDVIVVGWLPSEGWFCAGCDADTRARPCAHVRLAQAAIGAGDTP